MKKFRLMSILMIATLSVGARTVESFNNGWEFAKDGGAFEYARVPQDWAIAGPFDPEGDGDTAKLPWKGTGVYRKKLVMAEEPKGRVFLDFDGVMARSAVFVNGQVCGRGDYGYLGYRADATCFLMKGTNDVEVRCSTKELTSRFYPGGGMYRNTWIVTTDNVYIEDDSLAVETVDVLTDLAKVKVSGKVTGRAATNRLVRVSFELTDPDGRTAATGKTEMELEAFASAWFERTLEGPIRSFGKWSAGRSSTRSGSRSWRTNMRTN